MSIRSKGNNVCNMCLFIQIYLFVRCKLYQKVFSPPKSCFCGKTPCRVYMTCLENWRESIVPIRKKWNFTRVLEHDGRSCENGESDFERRKWCETLIFHVSSNRTWVCSAQNSINYSKYTKIRPIYHRFLSSTKMLNKFQ